MGVVGETLTLQRTDFTKAWSALGLHSFTKNKALIINGLFLKARVEISQT